MDKPKYEGLAEQFGEQEFDPEQNEQHERLRLSAANIIDCYDWDPGKEDFLVITDTKVIAENPFMVKALEYELKARGKAAAKDRPVLILTSMSRSHSKETGAAIRGDVQLNRDRADQILSSRKKEVMPTLG